MAIVIIQVYDIIKPKEILGLNFSNILSVLEELNCDINNPFTIKITKDNVFDKTIELSVLADSTF